MAINDIELNGNLTSKKLMIIYQKDDNAEVSKDKQEKKSKKKKKKKKDKEKKKKKDAE